MATAATTPNVQNPKKIPVHPRPSDHIPNPPPSLENVHSLPVNSSTTPPSSGGGGDPKAAAAAAAAHSDSSDATGAVIDIQKKIRRAERFGMPVQLSEEEKRNSRAERFGTGIGSHGSRVLKKSEESKRKARAERFGLVQSTSADEEAKKKARLARFTPASKHGSVEEDKRKARVIRFSQNQSISLKQANCDEKITTKAAVLGKAGGAP